GQDGGFTLSGGQAVLPLFGFPWNPNNYVLTTPDNLSYNYEQHAGLQTIKDLNGNIVSFSAAGVQHSSGASIQFIRDPKGRITKIIDPAGNPILYSYDAGGNLASVMDQVGNKTGFDYYLAPAHYLKDVVDPLGRMAAR